MDVMRQVAAAAAVILLTAGILLAARCHTKGLIGKKRALAIGGTALCTVLAASGLAFSFVPRTVPVEAWQADAEAGAAEDHPSSEDGSEHVEAGASVTGDGRVVYRAATPEVEPADPGLPARGDEQDGSNAPQDSSGDQGNETALDDARQEEAGQGQPVPEEPEAGRGQQGDGDRQETQDPSSRQDSDGTSQQQTYQTYQAHQTTQPSGDAQGQPQQASPGQTTTAPSGPQTVAAAAPTGSLRLEFLPGGGCTLAVLPDSTTVLVGAGSSEGAAAVLERLSALGVSEVDYLVITGPEEGCCGGAAQTLSRVRVGSLLVPASRGGDAWAEVEAEAARAGVQATPVEGVLEVSSGGAGVSVVPAGDGRLVVRAACGGSSALLPGCTDPGAAVAASPGRADVLDATGWAQGGETLSQAARGLWPDVAVVAADAARGSLEALAMARAVEADSDGLAVTMGADGSLSTSL